MKPKFWLDRWQAKQIGFHQEEYNSLLVESWPGLELAEGARVFVPLCGKSLDMRWLESEGHRVVGVELAQLAIENYFEQETGVSAEPVDRFVLYSGGLTEIYHGDFFDLTTPLLSGVEAVFDRGALVALPQDMRFRYVDHMLRIIPDGCQILLITLEYDQSRVSGPPHSVSEEEVEKNFGVRCDVSLVDSIVTSALPPHFEVQGVRQAIENVYRIKKQE